MERVSLTPALLVLLFFLAPTKSTSGDGSGQEDSNPIPLNFIFISSDNLRLKSSGSIPAVDIALEMVEERRVLPGYSLRYTVPLDSQCNRTTSLDVFHDAVEEREGFTQYVGIIGCGCSVASLPVAEISHYYNMPMISWTSASAELSDRLRFRTYYRTSNSEESHSPGLAGLLRHFGWRQVAMLTQIESLFISAQDVVTTLAPDIDIVTRQFYSTQNPLLVEDLFVKTKDMRIFVLNMYVNHARTILCEAYRQGMYYPRYLWITPGWYGYTWWGEDLPDNCTKEHMEQVLEYSLSAVQYPIVNESEVSELGLSTQDFRRLYAERLGREARAGKVYKPDLTAPLAFDAVWTLTFALKRTMEKIERGEEGGCSEVEGDLVPLEQFDYRNKKLGCLLRESMDETDFLGISGVVQFDSNGNRIGNTVRISQYQRVVELGGAMDTPLIAYAVIGGEREFDSAMLTTNVTVQYSGGATEDSVWPEGVPPDGVPIELIVTIELPLTVIYYILASAGIVFALVCLGFNIAFRKKKVVRLTSPNLNYLIIVGATSLYVSVFFWVSPAENGNTATILCNFRVWFFSLGNTLCLAVVLSKMWRVYYIFSSPSPKRKPKPPQDWHLLIIVAVIVAVDLLILLVPTAKKSARLHGELTESQEHTDTEDDLGVRQDYYFYGCYNETEYIWLIISYAYKLLLQLAAIYFAFMTRKVKVKALNDSKQIAAIIYVTSLLLIISVFGFWIGLLYLNTSAAIFAAAQLVTASVFLGVLFIPKMVSLKLDPEGNNIFSASQYTTSSGGHLTSDLQKLSELTSRVKELEAELEKYQANGSPAYKLQVSTPQQLAFSGDSSRVQSEIVIDNKSSGGSSGEGSQKDSSVL